VGVILLWAVGACDPTGILKSSRSECISCSMMVALRPAASCFLSVICER
jgi:hypothetical protein